MDWKLTILVFLAMTITIEAVNKFRVQKFVCSADNETTSDLVYKYKGIRNKYGKFTFGITFNNPINNFWLDIKSYIKGSANYYRRGAIHIRQDLCKQDNGLKDLIFLLSPVVKDMLSKLFKPCPFSGRFELVNYTIDSIDSVARIQFLATGEYKAIAQFIDMDRNKVVYQVEVENYYKGASLTQI